MGLLVSYSFSWLFKLDIFCFVRLLFTSHIRLSFVMKFNGGFHGFLGENWKGKWVFDSIALGFVC
jgi:hypothetical protein